MGKLFTDHGGVKNISRNILANGNYLGHPVRGFNASRVLTLPGFDVKQNTGSGCILYGMERGYIKPDAKVFGVENKKELVPLIEKHAHENGIDMEVEHADLNGFKPPENIDLAILDLMCVSHDWVGETIVNNIIPSMNEKRAGIGINLNVQHLFGHRSHASDSGDFRKELEDNIDDYISRE